VKQVIEWMIPGQGQRMADWATLVAAHSAALEAFLHTARQIPPGRWTQPIALGKWTPAEITSHLCESYSVLRAELTGRPGMELRLRPLQRWVLRHTLLPRILASGKFPAGARAPRETRPRPDEWNRGTALHTLSTEADSFVQDLSDRARAGRIRLTHAYFGTMSARQSIRMVTVHIRHHAHQLAHAAESSVSIPHPSL
jgi:hypothetical protein